MDPIRATDPWPAATLQALPVTDAAAELLEEVLAEPGPRTAGARTRASRPWAAALGAAAAVAVLAGGVAWWAGGTGAGTGSPAPGVATQPVPSSQAADASAAPTDEGYTTTCRPGAVTAEPSSLDPADPPRGCSVEASAPPSEYVGDGWSSRLRQPPPLPVLPELPGWRLGAVRDMDAKLVGPDGRHAFLVWFAAPPSAERSDGNAPETTTVLGSPTRIYTFGEGSGEYAATGRLTPAGEALLIESGNLGPAEFRELLASLTPATLADYRESLRSR